MISPWRGDGNNPKRLLPPRPQLLQLLLFLLLALGLSGCMEYDLGIQFNSQTAGAIVQTIHLNRLTTVGAVTFDQWFDALEQETHDLQGFSRRTSPQDLELTLPFVNGADLVAKFNQLFAESQTTALFPLTAQVALTQQNALLALRNTLKLQVDLTRLGITTPEGDRLLDTAPLLHINFYLQTPWGVQWRNTSPQAIHHQSKADFYALQSGEMNTLSATFWVPSPLGIGTLAIIILITIAEWLRPKLSTPSESLEREGLTVNTNPKAKQ